MNDADDDGFPYYYDDDADSWMLKEDKEPGHEPAYSEELWLEIADAAKKQDIKEVIAIVHAHYLKNSEYFEAPIADVEGIVKNCFRHYSGAELIADRIVNSILKKA